MHDTKDEESFFFFWSMDGLFQEQQLRRDYGLICSIFLLPWDKPQLENTSVSPYLHQTIPSDCIKPFCNKIERIQRGMKTTLGSEVAMQTWRIMGPSLGGGIIMPCALRAPGGRTNQCPATKTYYQTLRSVIMSSFFVFWVNIFSLKYGGLPFSAQIHITMTQISNIFRGDLSLEKQHVSLYNRDMFEAKLWKSSVLQMRYIIVATRFFFPV